MEPSSTVQGVSFRKKLRSGQRRVFEAITTTLTNLVVQLPTGYGKTLVLCGVYAILAVMGRVTRLLAIFPTDEQLRQFQESSGPKEFKAVGLKVEIVDIRRFALADLLKYHRSNTVQIFCITIQSLCESRGLQACQSLMQTGKWMLAIDECQHYGVEKSWGLVLKELGTQMFLLCMSATPFRPYDDSPFSDPNVPPNIRVTYKEAVKELAVKKLIGHSYEYKIDTVDPEANVKSFTTAELVAEAGGKSPEAIEKLLIERKMRWSPKYVSPIVRVPIERMLKQRLVTGYRLQALLGAMCVSHAELVRNQVADMFPELNVEWAGTGPNGRTDEQNRDVLRRYCRPEKDEKKIDVLVHVGKAGEGLDTVYVSEVVFLRSASLCNRRAQDKGRASRHLEGVIGNISFDSSSELAAYVGEAIMDAIDKGEASDEEPPTQGPPEEWELSPLLPEEPGNVIANISLLHIDSGDIEVQRAARLESQWNPKVDFDALLKDPEHPDWARYIEITKIARQHEASSFDLQSMTAQWQDNVTNALSVVTGHVIAIMMKNGRFEKSLPGDIKRRINTEKKKLFGAVRPDIECCKKHYHWLRKVEVQILEQGIPSWLL